MIVNALKSTSASNVSIISALIPVVTLMLEVLLFKSKIRFNQIIALLLASIAVVIVITKGQIFQLFEITWCKGDLYMLSGVCCISLYSVLNSRIKFDYTSLQIVMYYFLITTIFSIPFAIKELPFQFHLAGLLAILYQSILGTAVTYILIQLSLRKFGANYTMIYFNLIPITALILAIVFLKEPITIPLVVGSVIMIFSIGLSMFIKNICVVNQKR